MKADEKLQLTEVAEWDAYWSQVRLPAEIRPGSSRHGDAILGVVEKYLPRQERLKILEIGGAPGQYLAYMHKHFHYDISSLDYSRRGNELTEANFRLLGIPGRVFQKDLFGDISDLPQFDIVYSLGFIEHFADLDAVIGRHLALLRPGGLLLIGSPSFLGINRWILRRLDPGKLETHNLRSMDIDGWSAFEEKYDLQAVYKGYVGGFEPRMFTYANRHPLNALLYTMLVGMKVITAVCGFLRKCNSRYWSGYVMGIYRKEPEGSGRTES